MFKAGMLVIVDLQGAQYLAMTVGSDQYGRVIVEADFNADGCYGIIVDVKEVRFL